MSLLVVIPGFGDPQLELKRDVLHHNLTLLRNTFEGSIHVMLFTYNDHAVNIEFPNVRITEHIEKGYLGEKLYKYVTPDLVKEYIVLLLDDVRLSETVHVQQLLDLRRKYSIDILSPTLTTKSYKFMMQKQTHTLRKTNGIELFCYVMDSASYAKYYSMLDKTSAWLWGIDFSVGKQGLTTGLVDTMSMEHLIQGVAYKGRGVPNPFTEKSYNAKRFHSSFADFGNLVEEYSLGI